MDPKFPFGRSLEKGESSHTRNENDLQSEPSSRFRRRRHDEEWYRRNSYDANGRMIHWSLPPHHSDNIRPPRV